MKGGQIGRLSREWRVRMSGPFRPSLIFEPPKIGPTRGFSVSAKPIPWLQG
jgi:hypothetical protein